MSFSKEDRRIHLLDEATPAVRSLESRWALPRQFRSLANLPQARARHKEARRGTGGGAATNAFDPSIVRITSNENLMGPTKEGIEAMAKVGPLGWRYENLEFEALLQHGEREAGLRGRISGLEHSARELRSGIHFADETLGDGIAWVRHPANLSATRSFRYRLARRRSNDQGRPLGAYYICNPNNPTGTLTSRKDFEYILANKKKDAVLIIDEAYVHFGGEEICSSEHVRADKDVALHSRRSTAWPVCAQALFTSDLLARRCPNSARWPPAGNRHRCAAASMKILPTMLKERIAINKKNRDLAFELKVVGASYMPSVSNFFMMSVKVARRWAGDGQEESHARGQPVAGMARTHLDGRHLRRDAEVQYGHLRSGQGGTGSDSLLRKRPEAAEAPPGYFW